MAGLRKLFADRSFKVATMIAEFDSPGIGHILKGAGLDFVFLDLEHSGFGIDTAKRVLRYLQAAELPALVRPPSKDYHHIARALDAGAEGLMLPMVASRQECETILKYMKYVPLGERGVGLSMAHDDYTGGAVLPKLKALNERNAMVALIETAEGVENIDDIARVRGVDALWVGHFDLSCSLGVPGEFDSPKFRSAIRRVVKAAADAGKPLGRLSPSVADGVKQHKAGFTMICYSGDSWLLQVAAREGAAALRAKCKGGPGDEK